MRKLRALCMRILGLVAISQTTSDFDAELASNVAMHTEEGIRAGLGEAEARRRALIQLGGAEQTRQAYRERATLPWLESVLRDVRYALRGLRRNPVFALTAIATLALGIGATTAVFSVVDRILFRALPYAHDEQLVSVGLTAPIIPREFMLGGSYYQWKENQKPFQALTSEAGVNECDLTERNPKRLSCAGVEANFLPTLGLSPILGRNFLPEEDRPNGPKAALISYGLWLTQYGRDPGIVNRLVSIDGHSVRVVGVLPKEFEMPGLEKTDIVLPEALDPIAERKADPGHVLYAFARLKPGITIPQAIAQLQPVFDYSLSLAPPRFRSEVHLRVQSLRDRQMQDARFTSWILFGAVLAVLLIACANVTSLLLTRAATRERELAVRSALGARTGRLVRQMLTEALLLSLLGAIIGLALAQGLLNAFVASAPSGLPFLQNAHLDLRIICFTVLLSLFSGLFFGLIPALHRPRSLAFSARSSVTGTRARLRQALVVAQIAISMILLAGAALLVRSFTNLQTQALGMKTHGVFTAAISLNRELYSTPQAQMQFFSRVEAELRRLPGVTALALSDTVPPGGFHRDQIFSIISVAGRPPQNGGTGGMVAWRFVTPGYFQALDIPIVRGRAFSANQRTETSQPLILSSLLAARLFPSQDPLGQRVQLVPNGPWFTVQGIAADVKNDGLDVPGQPEFYRLRRNLPDDWQQAPSAVFVLKTSTPPASLAPWIRTEVAQVDPTVPVEIASLKERVGDLADKPRFETALLSFFAITGLAMAIIGLYGVIAYTALQRTPEIGIRMALGASRSNVLRLILMEGIRLILIGGIVGLVSALALSRLLRSLLFSIGPYDPVSFFAVTALLALVALAATLLPARLAMKVNPTTVLRME